MQGRDFGLGLPELLGEQFLWRPSRVRVRAPGRAIPVASGSHEGKPGIKKEKKEPGIKKERKRARDRRPTTIVWVPRTLPDGT